MLLKLCLLQHWQYNRPRLRGVPKPAVLRGAQVIPMPTAAENHCLSGFLNRFLQLTLRKSSQKSKLKAYRSK